ncbi:MAG: hypothetical protein PHQ11_11815 [Paludibacter sp.]|nr:hypothetical protein [Paludibacter sp.]MDD4199559.1 hypothetical protein [Paludibacter sp.]MDD4427491.1 hypothetical protein [Paludibacter sp.]
MKTKFLILFVTLLFTCFSCLKKEESIKIGILEGPSSISFIRLIDHPPVVKGRKVEFIIKSEPLQIQAMMMQNQLDFAVLPTIMAVNLYNKGVSYKLLAIPVWGTLYLMGNNPEIDQLNQIQDEKVYLFGQASTSAVLFREILAKKNINHIQIDYTYHSNMELSTALLQRKISLAIISEPLVSILLHKDSTLKILSEIRPEGISQYNKETIFAQTSFLVNSNMTGSYKDIIKAISSYYSESCNFTYQQAEKAAELLVRHGFYPEKEVALQSIPRCNIHFRYAADVKENIHQFLKIFYTFEPQSIGGKMPDDNFIYSE